MRVRVKKTDHYSSEQTLLKHCFVVVVFLFSFVDFVVVVSIFLRDSWSLSKDSVLKGVC